MQVLLNTSSPVIIIALTLLVALIVLISKKSETGVLLIVSMVLILCLLIYHSVYLDNLTPDQDVLISQAYHCLAVDLVLLLISLISFLWIDDIIAKDKKLKSYDDSLSWFWDKI